MKEDMLRSGFQKVFVDQLKDVIRQLGDNPDRVPVVEAPYVQKVGCVVLWSFVWFLGGFLKRI